MTYKQKYNENKRLIQSYSDFLLSGEVINPDSYLKLVNEIARLDTQNKEIEEMPYHKVIQDNDDYKIMTTSI